tara:strand:+ start:5852 stop:6100 length:249 start_codon:yes stop_codon:yes gene_type:complete
LIWLFLPAAENGNKFFYLFPAICNAISSQCMFNTGRYVIVQNGRFKTGQGGFHRLHLPDHIDTISILGDHFGYPSDLALNTG